ncbi:MAG: hypothetical protein QOF11_348 [Chloroflexota bacterium]|jgi:hypothetical protein|nr:hypothetical protein [Chloroflexota bacterium]
MADQDDSQNPKAGPDPDEDDVEGHRSMASQADGGPDEFGRMRAVRTRIETGDEDDVEGHFGHLKSPSSRGE